MGNHFKMNADLFADVQRRVTEHNSFLHMEPQKD